MAPWQLRSDYRSTATPGQLALATTIMSPELQEKFSLYQNAIPVRLDVRLDKFDECAKASLKDERVAITGRAYVPSLTHGMAQKDDIVAAITDVVTRFMNTTQDSKSAVSSLWQAVKKSR
ncbi:Extracellular solute-binding protein family 1 (fragment) [Burkholderia sp. 8Y]